VTATVSRAGGKLEAAIAQFHLAPRIKGARAVDVGASTGGFTESLLRHGATHVTAVDVGKGQLHPSLAGDARVTNLEGVHWKTLALDVAPGPFDFFTVDVSFVAARTMLRGLAFRLRDGAEGVILVKPQFELPDSQVRGGNVTDPQLRKRALDQVREKAETLGFELVEHADSPVAGREGTVEILAHLRFKGRSAKLPQKGERRRGNEKANANVRANANVNDLRMFAVASPGLEAVVEKELRTLDGIRDVNAVPGGVEFGGDQSVLYRANLWLRTATRVLVRLGELEAREFAKMRRRASTLPWPSFVAPDAPLDLHVSQTKSRLYHTGAIAETLEHAVDDALGKRTAREGAAPAGIFVRGLADQWTLSVDSSGELLHKRGWREESALAPMRETLAAAMLELCEWDPTTPLVDPMCGAGTIAVEAALRAMRIPPGRRRGFAFQSWPVFDASLWQKLLDEADAQTLAAPPAPIRGSDHSPAAVRAARANAERAAVAQHITFEQAELSKVTAPPGPGLVLVNPPYGKRIGSAGALGSLYKDLGRMLRMKFAGWRAGVLIPDRRLDSAIHLKPLREHRLDNGGIRVRLVVYAT
jgi:putative N6-adenine-specific DNA methylase